MFIYGIVVRQTIRYKFRRILIFDKHLTINFKSTFVNGIAQRWSDAEVYEQASLRHSHVVRIKRILPQVGYTFVD